MKPRLTRPEKNNRYYNREPKGFSQCIKGQPCQEGLDVLSNCVGYACGRFNEIIGHMKYKKFYCNAENFIKQAKKFYPELEIVSEPTLGGINVWEGLKGAGHVDINEAFNDDGSVTCSYSNYGGTAFGLIRRTNKNGNWGQNKNFKYLGCIVNPAVGKILVSSYKQTQVNEPLKGKDYITLFDMYVHRTPDDNRSSIKNYNELTTNGKQNAVKSNKAIYKKGTVYTALDIIINSRGTYAKTPSGYVCMIGASGRKYYEAK